MPEFLNIALYEFKNNYFNFKGRASRKIFWNTILAYILIGIAVSIISLIPILGALIYLVWTLGTLIPMLAIQVRRLHDVNKSGLLLLAPYAVLIVAVIFFLIAAAAQSPALAYIGIALYVATFALYVYIIVLFCLKGTDGQNNFGDPAVENILVQPKAE
ncbi:MAG: DUF805 domain-containing protein [Succinivibrio sp.]